MELTSLMQLPSQQAQRRNELALTNPLLEPSLTGLIRRILRRQLGPLCTTAENPQHTVQNRPRVVPRTAAIILTPRRAQDRPHQFPLFV